MSITRVIVLTVAAAAATTILALRYLLCGRRSSKQSAASKASSSSGAEDTCCLRKLFQGRLSRSVSRASTGAVAEPLLGNDVVDKCQVSEDAGHAGLSNQTVEDAEDSTAAARGAEKEPTALVKLFDVSQADVAEALQPVLACEPQVADLLCLDSPKRRMDLPEVVKQKELTAQVQQAAPCPSEQPLCSSVIPQSFKPEVQPEFINQGSANQGADASLEGALGDGTGTLVAYGKPDFFPFHAAARKAEESSSAPSLDEALSPPSQQPLSSQATLLKPNGSSIIDAAVVNSHSPRTSIDIRPPAPSKEQTPLAATSTANVPASAASLEPRIEFFVVVGPSKGTSFVSTDLKSKVHIGRLPACQLTVHDNEVSGNHCVVVFSVKEHCWKLADVGSLNGTHLNGQCVSKENRQAGDLHTLLGDNMVKLGTATQIQIKCFIPPRHRGSMVAVRRSLSDTQRLHLFRNKINFTPLRLEGCIVTRTGREHKRHSAPSEDLTYYEAPFRQFQQAGLFCVFDGHNGRQAAELAKQYVPDEIVINVNGASSLLGQGSRQEALEAAFLAADARLSADEGCTATAVVAERAEDGSVLLQIANVGDSAAVYVNPQGDSIGVKMTEDHRVVNPVEKERLKEKGFKGTTRLYGLALSRSMGDKFLKDVDVGLIAKPFVSEVLRIKPEDVGILVVASDGLWDVVTPERATKLVRIADQEVPGSADHMAERLLMFAVEHQSHDDITVMVLRFNRSVEQPVV